MQINSVQQPTAFKGYLKFRYGRYINTRNITTVLYDYTNIVKSDKYHSAAFLMSDGLKYIIKYMSTPKSNLISNIIAADKDHKTIVDVDAIIVATNDKSTLQDDMQNHNMYYPGNGE